MVCESENTFLSISRPVTQEIGSDPFSPFVHLCVHFCFVVIIHCDLAMGVTLGKVRKMGLLKDTDKCRAWLGNLVCFKLNSQEASLRNCRCVDEQAFVSQGKEKRGIKLGKMDKSSNINSFTC